MEEENILLGLVGSGECNCGRVGTGFLGGKAMSWKLKQRPAMEHVVKLPNLAPQAITCPEAASHGRWLCSIPSLVL